MEHTLPSLPYAYDALEPYIDAQTMEIHHKLHHAGYVKNLNTALAEYPELQKMPLDQLVKGIPQLPNAIQVAVKNHGGGHLNHSFFWESMQANARDRPFDGVGLEIYKHFKSFIAFKDQFNKAALTVFGSGWAWVCVDDSGKLVICTTPNQESPITQGLQPILGLDVWEHAYYLRYQNKRASYIDAWWYVINWESVEERYRMIVE